MSAYNPPMKRGKAVRKTEAPRRGVRFDRALVYALAVALFILPLFILPSATEYGYTKTILALVVVSVLVVVWGISGWLKGTWSLRIPWITWPFLGLVAASLFSLLHATNGRFVVQSLVLLVYFFVLLLLVANAAREKRDVVLLLGSFLVSTTLVALYGLLQYAGVMRGPSEGKGLEQVISTLGNKEYVAGVLAYVFFPAMILLFRVRSALARAAVVLLVAFDFGSLMLFQQAGANLALVGSSVVLLVGWVIFRPIEPLRRARRWVLALLLAVALAYLVEAPSGPLNSVVGLSADDPSWIAQLWTQNSGATRAWDWWIGFEMWKSSPWVGVGLGNYKLDFLPFKAQFLATPRGAAYDFYIARAAQAHNEYVQTLAEVGLLGALAVVGFLLTLAGSLLHRLIQNKNEDDRLDLLLCAAGLAAVVVHALVSFPAHLPASSLAAILVCGIALSPAYGEKATRVFALRGWGLKATVVALALIGAVVSVVAVRDLDSNILLNRGIQELQLGQTAQAQTTLEQSIRLDFAPHEAYFYLSTAQALLNDLPAAFESVARCRTRFVDENMYVLYAELAGNMGKYAEAKQAVDLLLATHPSQDLEIRARYIKAGVTLREGDTDSATAQLQELVAYNSDFETARILLANIFLARGLRDDAKTQYNMALGVVQRKLADAEQKLAGATTMTTTTYGELSSSITSLRSERDSILEHLKSLQNP